MPGRHSLIERREDMRREADYLYTMRIARDRFKLERRQVHRGIGFRAWARKTYTPAAVCGKLRAIVRS